MAPEALPVLLIAGIPGSGKTTIATHLAQAVVLSADDFYLACDDPALPMKDGLPDWEDIEALDMAKLQLAVTRLTRGEITSVPCYSMRLSKPVGEKLVDPSDALALVVEGVHSFELSLQDSLRTYRILIVTPVWKVAVRRLRRDISEGRYSWRLALTRFIPLLLHYRNYNRHASKKANRIVRSEPDSSGVAKRIQILTGFWDSSISNHQADS